MTAPTPRPAATLSAEAGSYLRTQVLTATPEQLRLMLLDGAIKGATLGREALIAGDFEGVFRGISQARDIVLELLTTIRADVAPELAEKVKALYSFIFKELCEVSVHKDPARVGRILELLRFERETWVMLMDRLAQERHAPPSPSVSVEA
ncbi:MAG: flagellar protein FliS [Phycisphaerae bacterium]|nr:flagellar protein FliS [Phycisphaerae bacterium]